LVVVFGCALVVLVGVSWIVVKWAPAHLASTKGLTGNDRVQEIARVRTALLAILAGSLAAIGAIYTARTFALNRQGQITERFTRAVEQLGNEAVDVRLGGIYALERLARESPDDHGPIVEILTAFVREHAPWRSSVDVSREENQPSASSVGSDTGRRTEASSPPRTDVQAALTVLGRREADLSREVPMKLMNTALSHTMLGNANLVLADFTGAHLEAALLGGANLQAANFSQAHLEDVGLGAANLRGAHLWGTHLERADLLGGVNLSSAQLAGAHLRGAKLSEANLEYAMLVAADLTDTNLREANLKSANLTAATLTGANLEDATLSGATYSHETVWPEGFDPAAAGAILRTPDADSVVMDLLAFVKANAS
jgi:hypothetical protein